MSKRIGDDIRDIVQNAVNTMDFHQLNRDIGNTVNGALDEVRNALGITNNQNFKNPKDSYWHGQAYKDNNASSNNNSYRKQYNHNNQNNRSYTYGYQYHQPQSPFAVQSQKGMNYPVKKQNSLIPNVPVGKVSGILLTVFGTIGVGVLGIAVIVLCLVGYLIGNLNLLGAIALAIVPVLFGCIYMSSKGSQIRKRLKRFRRYLAAFQNRSYCSIKELSTQMGVSNKFIIKDLRKMISIGMFPEGHIDEQETCLILNRESYGHYMELQKNMRMQKFEKDKTLNSSGTTSTPSEEAAMSKELRDAIESGRSCISQIKEANDVIHGEEISKKLLRLEVIIGKIFNYVELHPIQLPEIQKFMDYYLPTTLKLVNTYKEFDKQTVQGDNITSAKNEIENTLDTINLAFEKLFDSLFMNAAMDVSTDISVLETLLAQEGLTKKDFIPNETIGGLTNE